MQERFYDNLKHEIQQSKLYGNQRIKIDWIYPDCLGLKGNKLDQLNSVEVPPNLRKKFFVQLCLEIGKRLNIKWNEVL